MQRVTDVISREELATLTKKSDVQAAVTFLVTGSLIGLAFALVAVWPNPLAVVVALVLLGNRQLGLAVLMHDAAHRGLFRSGRLNLMLGRWFCAAPLFADLDLYWKKHAKHHVSAGSSEDPDLENYRHYAVPKDSFRRKILRDLTGRTGLKTLYNVARAGGPRVMFRPLLVNLVLLGILTAVATPWLYLLWIGAYLTTYMLFARLRLAAEHAVVPDLFDPDPRKHTRTTLARWWERLTLAPNRVNYHLEHHLLPHVPPYHLPKLHALLQERGYYEEAEVVRGYGVVLGKLTRPLDEPRVAVERLAE